MTLTAVAYIRVSTDGQVREGVSLDAQRERVAAYATAKGLDLTEVFVEEGASGKTLERPALQALLACCRAGSARHVIVWRLDRLTRRTKHLLTLVEDVFLAKSIELHSVSESLDTSTPHGRFVLTLFGGLAQMERELIGERTRAALAFKWLHGQPNSHPPLGFRVVGRKHRMTPVASELRTVHRILALWRAGTSLRSIAGTLNAEGVPTKQGGRWHASTVKKVVDRRDWYASVLEAA